MNGGQRIGALMLLLAGACNEVATSPNAGVVPVMLYPDPEHGTCSSGLQVNAGGAALRAGPGENYPVITRLAAGHVVSGCDAREGWTGVIDATHGTCSIGIMLTTRQPYSGPCASGWIDQSSLTGIYG